MTRDGDESSEAADEDDPATGPEAANGAGERAAGSEEGDSESGRPESRIGATAQELGLTLHEPDTGPRAEGLSVDEPPRHIGAEAEALDRTRTPAERLRLPDRVWRRIGLLLAIYAVIVAVFATDASGRFEPLVPLIVGIAFVFQATDSAAGMGFGTGLAPLLFVFGYSPLQIVPVLIVSQTLMGFVAGFVHNDLDNVTFGLRPINDETKLLGLLVATGSIAVTGSIVLAYYALALSDVVIRTYVSVLVVVMGLAGLLRASVRSRIAYRPHRLVAFAVLAGVNKGIGGGGYGPVVTLGQIFSGVYEKSAVAITTLAEAFVSLTGVLAFLVLFYYGVAVDFTLFPSIFAGGFLAAIVAPYLVRVVPNGVWRYAIPLYAFAIGLVGLVFGLEI